MKASKRWQDYATIAIGVLLFISPFVFGETSKSPAAPAAYALGVLLIVAGIVAAVNAEPRRSFIVNAPGIASVLTFLAPWVLGFTGVAGVAWAAWVGSVVTVLVGASLRLGTSDKGKTT
ncbi:MAG TPA: SPW repeat protein [Candidatus Solibacter sp.]|nr:SPW repeat protein [Candidatus Solibacter sp.]